MTTRDDIKQAALSLIPWPQAQSPHAWFSPVTKAISANSDGAFAHEAFHKVYDASPVRRSKLHSKAIEEMWCELFRFVFGPQDGWFVEFVRHPRGTAQMMAHRIWESWGERINPVSKFRALWHDWCEKAAQRPNNAKSDPPR